MEEARINEEFKNSVWSMIIGKEKGDCYICKTFIEYETSHPFIGEINYVFICNDCKILYKIDDITTVRKAPISLTERPNTFGASNGFRLKMSLNYYFFKFDDYYISTYNVNELTFQKYKEELYKFLRAKNIIFNSRHIDTSLKNIRHVLRINII